jgi:hypothetical protein
MAKLKLRIIVASKRPMGSKLMLLSSRFTLLSSSIHSNVLNATAVSKLELRS